MGKTKMAKLPCALSPANVAELVADRLHGMPRLRIEEDGCCVVDAQLVVTGFWEGGITYRATAEIAGRKIDEAFEALKKAECGFDPSEGKYAMSFQYEMAFNGWPDDEEIERKARRLVKRIAKFYRKEVHGGFCGERNAALDALKDRVESIDLIRELVGSQRCEGRPDFEPKPLETGQTDNRVTGEEIDALMEAAEFSDCKLYGNTTVVTAKFPNGWTMTEQSACIDPADYDREIGMGICKERMRNSLRMLEGYRKACENAKEAGNGGE